jgi:hypothetical protein
VAAGLRGLADGLATYYYTTQWAAIDVEAPVHAVLVLSGVCLQSRPAGSDKDWCVCMYTQWPASAPPIYSISHHLKQGACPDVLLPDLDKGVSPPCPTLTPRSAMW